MSRCARSHSRFKPSCSICSPDATMLTVMHRAMRWWSTRRWERHKRPLTGHRDRLCWSSSSNATSHSSDRHPQDRRRVVEGKAVVGVRAHRADVEETKSSLTPSCCPCGPYNDTLYASWLRDISVLLWISLVRTLNCIHYPQASFLAPLMLCVYYIIALKTRWGCVCSP